MKVSKILIILFLALSFFENSCKIADEESATKGNFSMAVDESFVPLMELEKEAHGYTYPKVKIQMAATSEGHAVDLLLGDSVRMIVISRELDTLEKKELAKTNIKYRSTKIAVDAVALITNRDNPDSLISVDELKSIFMGKVSTWQNLYPNGIKDSIIVVFDKGNSSNLSYINKKLGIRNEKIKIFASRTNKNVIDYVKVHKGALGVIGLAWISDKDSPLSVELKSGIRLMWVGKEDNNKDSIQYYSPSQSDLATKSYPFIRDLICISREPGTGPATGFMNYMKSDIGQRIVLKKGLLPSIMPTRRLKIK